MPTGNEEKSRAADAMPRKAPLAPWTLSALGALVGGCAGLGAVAFRGLIAFVHNLAFLGQLSVHYDANSHTPLSPWGAGIVLVPALGAVIVATLVRRFAPEAKGHGVPEVIDAIYEERGAIRPIVVLVKALASSISIGTGGSVGREGPIIQIGSALGSTLGQYLRAPLWQTVTLIACGAAGGIAATFNTPVGAVLFAVEILMIEVSGRTLIPVMLASASGTYVGRLFFGVSPSFVIPTLETPFFQPAQPQVLILYVALGLILGLVSLLYIRSLYAIEDFFDAYVPGSYAVRHALGMLAVGGLLYALAAMTGHYYVQGVGYATVQDILTGSLTGVFFLLALAGLKLLTTGITLGSGASGGVFSPALFLGAAIGASWGMLMAHVFPNLPVSPQAFAVAGMAAVVAGSTGAAITAIVMIFEMTLDYSVVVPMSITVAVSYGMRRVFCSPSIYTLKLIRRGRVLPEALQGNLSHSRLASEVMDTQFETLQSDAPLSEARDALVDRDDVSWFLVVNQEGAIQGVARREAVLAGWHAQREETRIHDIAVPVRMAFREQTPLLEILGRMRIEHTSLALVTRTVDGFPPSANHVVGLITKERIADLVTRMSEFFADG